MLHAHKGMHTQNALAFRRGLGGRHDPRQHARGLLLGPARGALQEALQGSTGRADKACKHQNIKEAEWQTLSHGPLQRSISVPAALPDRPAPSGRPRTICMTGSNEKARQPAGPAATRAQATQHSATLAPLTTPLGRGRSPPSRSVLFSRFWLQAPVYSGHSGSGAAAAGGVGRSTEQVSGQVASETSSAAAPQHSKQQAARHAGRGLRSSAGTHWAGAGRPPTTSSACWAGRPIHCAPSGSTCARRGRRSRRRSRGARSRRRSSRRCCARPRRRSTGRRPPAGCCSGC